ncbi:MAG: family 10 glycosylhydrolase [Odoribacteraceae bacterium]|jgi:uncharacterized lipoprotein YddW (UPF0748 family)|nr:family 10 glycosylhydrolase [Odoribacteraceae bacterium]
MQYLKYTLLPLLLAGTLAAKDFPKREFRGAWIQTVFQPEYAAMTTDEIKADFSRKLNALGAAGINAILFQARPEADAWYASRLEPWSRFLTGKQGVAPEPFFDPLAFLAGECHRRGMEIHAWINPFRAGTSGTDHLAPDHLYYRHPRWFVFYNGQLLFDPGIPECRQYLLDVARDIVSRYDIDAIHLDDYFYPYPLPGIPFPDDESFHQHGKGLEKNAWRRENINTLVRDLKRTIRDTKPWVRLGVSPFGIYRNKRDTPDGSGSDTRGTQAYADLHADVLLWERNGWIDYVIPQIYWETGHEIAGHVTLARWWNENTRRAHLYTGQDVARTMNAGELARKINLSRALHRVKGNCFWPANEILRDNGGVADSLAARYHRYPALIPAYTRLSSRRPARVEPPTVSRSDGGYTIAWGVKDNPREDLLPRYFVIYCFRPGERVNLEDATKIKAITTRPACFLPARGRLLTYRVVITAVDRYHNESRGRRVTLDL